MSAPASESLATAFASASASPSAAAPGPETYLGHLSAGTAVGQLSRFLDDDSLAVTDAADRVAADAAGGARPSADRLHRHALESIFAFLDLNELVAALRVARSWLAAVGSMRRMALEILWLTSLQLNELVQSATARHVAVLRSVEPIGAETLSALAGRMGHLRELQCCLELLPAAGPLVFPARLRWLRVDLAERIGAAQINAAIAAISRLPLLAELDIILPAMDPQVSFAPLAALPLLRSLDVCCCDGETELSDAQVDQLRALSRLRSLFMRHMELGALERLLRQPHDLQWQQIALPYWFDDEAAALLPQLPSLTEINAQTSCDRYEWLCGLPNLTGVDLMISGAAAEGPAASLVAGLQHCAQIESLRLANCNELTAAHLGKLLPRLPRLRVLQLEQLLIDSLSFLAQGAITGRLVRLRLTDCRQLPLAELEHVHALKGLTTLQLHGSFTAPLDEFGQSLYEPPSLILPLLEHFSYMPEI